MPSLELPPQDPEVELATLSAMLFDPGQRSEILAYLKADDLSFDAHRRIFHAIASLGGRSVEADPVAVGHEVATRCGMEMMEWADYAERLVDRRFSIPNGMYHAGLVKQYADRRRLLDAVHRIDDAARATDRDFREVMAEAEKLILEVRGDDAEEDVVPAVSAIDDALARLDGRRRGVVPGIPTGFRDLDDMTGGMHPQQLIVIGARPSMGKTAIGLQICLNVSIDRGEPAMFFSLEMSREEVADRILLSRGDLDGSEFRRGRLGPDDDILLHGVRESVASGRLSICDRVLDVASIASLARRQKIRGGLALIAVDYLQLVIPESRKNRSRQEEVAQISRDLKYLAKELRVPIVALSQLNRETEKREEKRPRMADLRETGGLENDAHHIWLLHRPDYYKPADSPGVAEVIVAKNRNGATGTIELQFEKTRMRFKDLDDPYRVRPHVAVGPTPLEHHDDEPF